MFSSRSTRRQHRPGRGPIHQVTTATVILAAATVMLFAVPHAGAAFKFLQKGSDMPEFSLKAMDGQEVNLAWLKEGKASVVIFWATWSPRSVEELKMLQGLYQQHKDKGLRVLGVNVNHLTFSMEDLKAVEKVIAETGVTFPIALDKGLEVYNTVGVVATPSTLVMTSGGQVAMEVSSFLSATAAMITESTEIALGIRQAPAAVAAAAEPAGYKPVKKAMLYYNMGRNLLKMGSVDKAADKLQLAATEDPAYAAPRVLLGHIQLERAAKDPAALEAAVRLFTEAVTAEPKNVSAVAGLGEGLLRAGRPDDAEARFSAAVALDPTYTPAISGLAACLSAKGKYPEAQSKFKEALDLNPLNPEVYQKRGASYEAQGLLKEAASDYRKAVELLLGYGAGGEA